MQVSKSYKYKSDTSQELLKVISSWHNNLMKFVIYLLTVFLISSCGTTQLYNQGAFIKQIEIDGRIFIWGPVKDQQSPFYKKFIFDLDNVQKEFGCGGDPDTMILEYQKKRYCPKTENGLYPRDIDLERICKIDNPNSFLYDRKGLITYTRSVEFTCINDNTVEQIFYTARELTKDTEKRMNELSQYWGISNVNAYKVFATPLFQTIKKTRDINVNELNIKSFTLDLPKNVTSNCNDKYEFLWFEGPVNPDTPEILKRILSDINVCKSSNGETIPVIITMFSGGGLLADGFKTGDILRQFDTYSIIQGGEYCASSCATAFIGSNKREILGSGQIMFHAPYSFDIAALEKGEIEIECQTKNLKLENYYIQMLGPEDGPLLYDRTMSYCGQNTTWSLNSDAAKIFGITNT